MVEMKAAEKEVMRLVKDLFTGAELERVRIDEGLDSGGDPSLFVRVVFETWPDQKESRKSAAVVDKFRTWLATKGDDRFPYFSFLTIADEKELSA